MKVKPNLGKAREIENLGHGERCFTCKTAKNYVVTTVCWRAFHRYFKVVDSVVLFVLY